MKLYYMTRVINYCNKGNNNVQVVNYKCTYTKIYEYFDI